MATQENEIYLPQSDKNFIKTEDEASMSDILTDCLATPQHDNSLCQEETDRDHGLLVCCICLTPHSVRPLRPSARRFLTAITAHSPFTDSFTAHSPITCGVCRACGPWLRRAVLVSERAKKAQDALMRLKSSGELNLTSINKLSSRTRPLCQLVSTHLPPDRYTYEYVYGDNDVTTDVNLNTDGEQPKEEEQQPDLKFDLEPVKNEEAVEIEKLSDVENDFVDDLGNSDSDFDRPLKPKKTKVKVKKKIKKRKEPVKKKVEKVKTEDDPAKSDPTFIRKYNRKPTAMTEDDRLMDEYFITKVLTPEEQKAECLKRKESRNYNRSQLKCDFCFKGFMHERAYEIHMAKHSEKMGELTCKICHRHCSTKRVLRKHMDHHKYSFSCKKCDYETKAKSSAKLHIDWHNGKKYNCEKCGMTFERQSTLLSHMRIKHPSDHVCVLCGYSFLGEKGIYFHRHLKHKLEDDTIPEDGPLCVECNIRFKTPEALAAHERVSPRHGECKRNDPPPKVRRKTKGGPETRGRRPLDNREPRDRRQRQGGGEGTCISCEQCGQQMFSSQEYRIHFNKFHPNCTRTQFPEGSKPSLCDLCGKMFKTPAILADHMLEHTDAPASYKCETCDKAFKKKSSLALHKNVHLGRRYPCPICGKMFNQVCNRDRHYTYVHSTIKDVKCDYCEKYFKSDEEKKLHITYVHFKKPYPKRARNKRQGGIDMIPLKRKRDGYIQEMVASHSWLQESESSEGSMHQ